MILIIIHSTHFFLPAQDIFWFVSFGNFKSSCPQISDLLATDKSKYFSPPFFKIVLTNPSTQGVILHFQDQLTRPVLVHTWQRWSINVMCSRVFWFECTEHVSPISVKWINLNSTNSANNCQTATVSFRFNQLFYVFTLLFKNPNHVLIY